MFCYIYRNESLIVLQSVKLDNGSAVNSAAANSAIFIIRSSYIFTESKSGKLRRTLERSQYVMIISPTRA